jgi:hypothetical protein
MTGETGPDAGGGATKYEQRRSQNKQNVFPHDILLFSRWRRGLFQVRGESQPAGLSRAVPVSFPWTPAAGTCSSRIGIAKTTPRSEITISSCLQYSATASKKPFHGVCSGKGAGLPFFLKKKKIMAICVFGKHYSVVAGGSAGAAGILETIHDQRIVGKQIPRFRNGLPFL